MQKISSIFTPKFKKNNLIKTAYTHLNIKQIIKEFIINDLNFTETEFNSIKIFIKESNDNIELKIKTNNNIHCVFLKTEILNLEEKLRKKSPQINRTTSLSIKIV